MAKKSQTKKSEAPADQVEKKTSLVEESAGAPPSAPAETGAEEVPPAESGSEPPVDTDTTDAPPAEPGAEDTHPGESGATGDETTAKTDTEDQPPVEPEPSEAPPALGDEQAVEMRFAELQAITFGTRFAVLLRRPAEIKFVTLLSAKAKPNSHAERYLRTQHGARFTAVKRVDVSAS